MFCNNACFIHANKIRVLNISENSKRYRCFTISFKLFIPFSVPFVQNAVFMNKYFKMIYDLKKLNFYLLQE